MQSNVKDERVLVGRIALKSFGRVGRCLLRKSERA